MDFNKDALKQLREYDILYLHASEQEILEGYEISKTIKEFDSPEDFLNEKDLFLLSQYYAYQNIIDSIELNKSKEVFYVFDEEDL